MCNVNLGAVDGINFLLGNVHSHRKEAFGGSKGNCLDFVRPEPYRFHGHRYKTLGAKFVDPLYFQSVCTKPNGIRASFCCVARVPK